MTVTTTVIKAILYRMYSSLVTVGIAYAVTGRLAASCTVGVCEFLTKIVTYSVFERCWQAMSGRSLT